MEMGRGSPSNATDKGDPTKEVHGKSNELGDEIGFGARENQPR
jgi:hypothetical protein